jgi:hypothetical protein
MEKHILSNMNTHFNARTASIGKKTKSHILHVLHLACYEMSIRWLKNLISFCGIKTLRSLSAKCESVPSNTTRSTLAPVDCMGTLVASLTGSNANGFFHRLSTATIYVFEQVYNIANSNLAYKEKLEVRKGTVGVVRVVLYILSIKLRFYL